VVVVSVVSVATRRGVFRDQVIFVSFVNFVVAFRDKRIT
jgi:hypothetical protein